MKNSRWIQPAITQPEEPSQIDKREPERASWKTAGDPIPRGRLPGL